MALQQLVFAGPRRASDGLVELDKKHEDGWADAVVAGHAARVQQKRPTAESLADAICERCALTKRV
jgi:hypothetical protein